MMFADIADYFSRFLSPASQGASTFIDTAKVARKVFDDRNT